MPHDIDAGQKHELHEQHFLNGQGLDLYLKKFSKWFCQKENGAIKNGHLNVRTQCTVKYSYPPQGFIMIMCVLLTTSDIGIDFQIIFYKLKELFLLRSFHMLQVLYLIILLSLLQALVLMTIPIFSHTRVFAVPCIKYVQYPRGCAVFMRHTHITREGARYQWAIPSVPMRYF